MSDLVLEEGMTFVCPRCQEVKSVKKNWIYSHFDEQTLICNSCWFDESRCESMGLKVPWLGINLRAEEPYKTALSEYPEWSRKQTMKNMITLLLGVVEERAKAKAKAS